MDLVAYLRFILALIFVLALIGALGWMLRRYGLGGRIAAARGGRLSIVEVAPLDARRRAILLRRDNVEHLLVLGPTRETVVESHIVADTDERVVGQQRDSPTRREGAA